MTKNKFTPGPYIVERLESQSIDITDGKNHIARIDLEEHYAECGDTPDRSDEENIANAKLMAAAPCLLEALEAVVRVADRKTVEFDMARAAIRKARGDVK